jgi:hypothetical protein
MQPWVNCRIPKINDEAPAPLGSVPMKLDLFVRVVAHPGL